MGTNNHIVFVFGSNELGLHGGGAAKFAYQKRGARWGQGYGHYGRSFAIPTKANFRETLSLTRIRSYVEGFHAYAAGRPDLTFQVTCIGCGLAGLNHQDIAPMFKGASSNCLFDTLWDPWLQLSSDRYWGTF